MMQPTSRWPSRLGLRGRRAASALAGLFLVMLSTPASADWEYTRWGMSPEQVAQASGGAVKVLPPGKRRHHPAPFSSETAAEGTFTEGALRLEVSFSFDLQSTGLTCVVLNSSGQDELLRQSFFRRLGKPQSTDDHAAAGMKTFTWRGKDEVGLTLMNGSSFATECKRGTIPPIE